MNIQDFLTYAIEAIACGFIALALLDWAITSVMRFSTSSALSLLLERKGSWCASRFHGSIA